MSKKTALVTGVSKGIGRATCKTLAQEGYEVYGTYLPGEDSEALELKSEAPGVTVLPADFKSREQVQSLIEQLKPVRFDAIVNNAGMFEQENFEDYDVRIWDNTLAVNLTAPFLISLGLKDSINPGGAIVNIASGGGFKGAFTCMAYTASKAALMNLTKSLANNFAGIGVRVNAIAPGWIDTGMSTQESYEAAKIAPLGRNGRPGEVADLVHYLISEESSFITGATLVIDGAYTCVDYLKSLEKRQDTEQKK